MSLTIPEEGNYSDVELELLDNEPPGLFPTNQDSFWGQQRKVFADYLQENFVDWLAARFADLSIDTASSDALSRWEKQLDLPDFSYRSIELRRSIIKALLHKGYMSRAYRLYVVELFVMATMGTGPVLTPEGLEITSGGIPFLPSEENFALVSAEGVAIPSSGLVLDAGGIPMTGAINIIENITNFSYDVRIRTDLAPDVAILTEVLRRLTASGITFTVTITASP